MSQWLREKVLAVLLSVKFHSETGVFVVVVAQTKLEYTDRSGHQRGAMSQGGHWLQAAEACVPCMAARTEEKTQGRVAVGEGRRARQYCMEPSRTFFIPSRSIPNVLVPDPLG